MDTHTTKDGRTLKMVEMENTHLENTAMYFAKQIREIVRISRMREFSLLNGIDFSEKKARRIIEYARQKIKDCVFELSVRDQQDSIKAISTELHDIYGRSAGVPFTFLIEESDQHDMDAFEEDEPF